MKLTGVILAGGSNRRFPIPKGLLKIGNKRIIETLLEIYQEFFDEIIISTNSPELYFPYNVKLVGDVYPSMGPLVGIYSSLINASNDGIFVTPCDAPFVKRELIEYLIDLHREEPVVICRYKGIIHPLIGIYTKKILENIEHAIITGRIRIVDLLNDVDCRIVQEKALIHIDPEGRSFVNINTPDDFKKHIGGRICLD